MYGEGEGDVDGFVLFMGVVYILVDLFVCKFGSLNCMSWKIVGLIDGNMECVF